MVGLLERYNNKLELDYALMVSEMFTDEECVNGDFETLIVSIINVNSVEKEAEAEFRQFKRELKDK